ncbi:hypothetical protein EOD42_14270 [Rhodovarius crocodyli]|uniref:Uncharacterized protein n=1 Tax=Rhodovarius crocodyli TaxID=1979269 RepID=A0A437MF35_9PROT|nr:hypothetical protein [Rhodovarius crocodyli]RVT96274.1 hypothetical protein EOD42_14270 [Rhodovarius crocodyli]
MSKTDPDDKRIASWFENHEMTERQSISWHMASRYRAVQFRQQGPQKLAKVKTFADSNYAFSVTWTPGSLAIAGDLGTFNVTHYQAMRTLESTLKWLDGIEFSYLMEKSSAKREFSAEATTAFIIQAANEPALEMLDGHRPRYGIGRRTSGYRQELQEYRRERAPALMEWRDEARAAIRARLAGEDVGIPNKDDFLPEPPQALAIPRRERRFGDFDARKQGVTDLFEVPDGWELWARLWQEFDYNDAESIFTAAGRREIKEALERHLSDGGPENAADLCYRLGMEDYYGTHEYPFSCRVHYQAIRAWVEKVKADRAAKTEAAA